MCKRQLRPSKWGYMINDNKNEGKMKNKSSKYDINSPRRRHG